MKGPFAARLATPSFAPPAEELIRGELFGIERLEQHAESLAAAQHVTQGSPRGRNLVSRLRDNGQALDDAYRGVDQVLREDRAITPADEWLLDNFHVAQEQIRQVRDDLPRGFYRGLPKLADGPLRGYPRVYGMAWALVAHTDSRFDRLTLIRFVTAYQRIQPLTIGELWAVAITLRVVLVENLCRAAKRIAHMRSACREADGLADRLLGVGGRAATRPAEAWRRFADVKPLPPAFVARLLQRLRSQDPRAAPARAWLDERLGGEGATSDDIVRQEHQRQSGMNVTVRNVITSMRLVSALDWSAIFESFSLVDATLRAGSDFASLDFATRDRYRHAIEDLARGSGCTELEIAARVMKSAARCPEAASGTEAERQRDPGYYLIANGRRDFETAIGFRVNLATRLMRARQRTGIFGYVGAIGCFTLFLVVLPLLALARLGVGHWPLAVLGILALAPASDLAVAMVNRAVADEVHPKTLPALELRDGVPPALRSMVVVPTLFTTPAALAAQIERLEIHYLASQDGALHFALLSDWTDSATESAAGDVELLDDAMARIVALNCRYPAVAGDSPRFFLLHRKRRWSAGQNAWIGWERKRGKLHELNRWLRGATDTAFVPLGGAVPVPPPAVRYVLTLDADTRLPRGAARRLVGKMAHPLNRPRIAAGNGRVVEGYGVLQPRITPSLPVAGEGSLFQRVFTSPSGLDPYAFAVSDVYQDLFGEGSYTGKGIYDVDTFETALEHRIPESTLLSHDLLEGIFARAGLVSDIELVEEFPARYDVAAARQHRWARGDWQLLPWILGRGRNTGGAIGRRGIPLIGRWKMLDNLRRTLSAPAAWLALIAGWTLSPALAVLWSGFVTATFAVPPFLPALAGIRPRRRGLSQRRRWRATGNDFLLALSQTGLLLALIAHQAWLMGDAASRTVYRLSTGRRKMLEWTTAAQSQRTATLTLAATYRWMSGSLALVAVGAAVVAFARPQSWTVALPFLALWAIAPALARTASRPPAAGPATVMTLADAAALRRIARQTWRFFETFVTAGENALPPDNFQEDPAPVVAHRTSPTNIGLYLLAVVAARDFGWLGTHDAVDRLEATLDTMLRLERFHGHFYNWYDTADLRPLDPKFISAVDSGNLAAHLITVAAACRELIAAPILAPRWRQGIADGLDLASESLRQLADDRRTHTVTRAQLQSAFAALAAAVAAAAPSALADLAAEADTVSDIARTLAAERGDAGGAELLADVSAMLACLRGHLRDARLGEASALADAAFGARLRELDQRATDFAQAMDFGLLYDPDRQLLAIGYRMREAELDPSCYDLLASEARLASFVAIAKGDLPTRHWFHLGRTLTPVGSGAALISWSGSMFEYLMPGLVLRAPPRSLLDETIHIATRRQMTYGTERGLPWGISESAYNARNTEHTYQYSSFGVPGLGLKRGLGEQAVVAPYATALAAMIAPAAAVVNFARLRALGAQGRYGCYEALDFTPARLPEGATVAVVRCYMAHHQGMTVVALANALHDGAMRSRFHAQPLVQATELLLQERTPRDVDDAAARHHEARARLSVRELVPPPPLRRFQSPHQAVVHTQLLSNGRYSVMMTAAGSGYSRWGGLAVTRWREDPTADASGAYIFLRDVEQGTVWSAGYQPSAAEPDRYEATFTEDRVEIFRRDGSLTTKLEVMVSPESDAEARRLTLTNLGRKTREIEVTSYAELALAAQAADAAHPAFSKMFVQTEFAADIGALLATRRRGNPAEPEIWAAHLAVVDGDLVGGGQFDTDRARFLGRGRAIRSPVSVIDGRPLSNTTGTVLDPIFSLRRRFRLAPGAVAHITFWTLVADARSAVLDLADKHRDAAAFERAATLAWTQAQIQLFHLGIGADEADLYQRLASLVLYSNPALRPASHVLARAAGAPALLWPYGISGDLPIVLARIDDIEDLPLARQLLQAHEYWRMKQLAVDLVFLNEHPASYAQELHAALEAMSRSSPPHGSAGPATGAVFTLRADLISAGANALLQSGARVVLVSRRGSLFDQISGLEESEVPLPRWPRTPPAGASLSPPPAPASAAGRAELEFFNGLGGFADGGREYVTILGEAQSTPAPWINVVANPEFGFLASADGGGYTWSVNSQQNQLTPWANDPVADPPGEVIYVRDLDDGAVWTATALPVREASGRYIARHGQGYTRFEYASHQLALTLLQFVPLDDPIKISRLTLQNQSSRTRRLSITAYVEWVLGATRAAAAPHVATEFDLETRALFARNHWNADFGARIAFADLGGRQQSWTGDRREFLGRNGALGRPAALAAAAPLSNRTGGGYDPCAALQSTLEIAPGATTEIVFFLGQAADRAQARSLLARYRAADLDVVLRAVHDHWHSVLGAVQVQTPDRSLDLMLNRWLLYQTLACRVWARTGLYQASGAFGFRDQLQDVLALRFAAPAIAREHLLRAAARQFVQGDVQHWWLPPLGQGVRTRISDDRIWLPYAAALYLESTADRGLLDHPVAFLDGPVLAPDQREAFFQPASSPRTASFYEHCALALDTSLAVGAHGLPLIGTGDWNDGFNRLGEHGRGESVWLGWFLCAALSAFVPLADARGEAARAARWRECAAALALALERDAWDGGWYRRAFLDDGAPLGSQLNAECRIDSIAQSWAVLSAAGNVARSREAMVALDQQLIRRADGLALLFTPPFDHSALNLGYVQGYPPGLRENGGQYTHAALWSVIAFALLRDGDKAAELFQMLNPIHHARTRADLFRYKVEPYVACADVYSAPNLVGRGGWTWYTGSAGWMYRAGLEFLLGFQPCGDELRLDPCIPKAWPGFAIRYCFRSATYEINVENPAATGSGVKQIHLDGVALPPGKNRLPLLDDGATHTVRVLLGAAPHSSTNH